MVGVNPGKLNRKRGPLADQIWFVIVVSAIPALPSGIVRWNLQGNGPLIDPATAVMCNFALTISAALKAAQSKRRRSATAWLMFLGLAEVVLATVYDPVIFDKLGDSWVLLGMRVTTWALIPLSVINALVAVVLWSERRRDYGSGVSTGLYLVGLSAVVIVGWGRFWLVGPIVVESGILRALLLVLSAGLTITVLVLLALRFLEIRKPVIRVAVKDPTADLPQSSNFVMTILDHLWDTPFPSFIVHGNRDDLNRPCPWKLNVTPRTRLRGLHVRLGVRLIEIQFVDTLDRDIDILISAIGRTQAIGPEELFGEYSGSLRDDLRLCLPEDVGSPPVWIVVVDMVGNPDEATRFGSVEEANSRARTMISEINESLQGHGHEAQVVEYSGQPARGGADEVCAAFDSSVCKVLGPRGRRSRGDRSVYNRRTV